MGLWDMAKSAGKAAGNAIAEKAARDREKYEEFDSYDKDELESKLKSSWYSAEDKMIIRKVLRDKPKKLKKTCIIVRLALIIAEN